MQTRTQMTGVRETAENTRSEWSAPYSSLLPNHLDLVKASAISPEVSRERGYRSETVKAHAQRLGFSPVQCCTPALLIPLYSVRRMRPVISFGPTSLESRMARRSSTKPRAVHGDDVDCHPRSRPLLDDPNKPLLITEGVRKADSAVSIGLPAITLLGVWGFRGSNEKGGKVAAGLGIHCTERSDRKHRSTTPT